LVVVSIISLLVAILMPSLRRAREQSKSMVCLANLRSQAIIIQQYTADFSGKLPPKNFWRIGDTPVQFNRILADYQGVEFPPKPDGIFFTPTGAWRCPSVPVSQDGAERWTHTGIIHHAPNTWLFNHVRVSDPDPAQIFSDAIEGWIDRYGSSEWRVLDRIRRPSDIIAIMDSVTWQSTGHGESDREARETIGTSCEITEFHPNDGCKDNRGSHDVLSQRPAVFLDGHAVALPSSEAYWYDQKNWYEPADGSGVALELYRREVRNLMWFIAPEEYAGPAE